MQSGKQKRAAIMVRRKLVRDQMAMARIAPPPPRPKGAVTVDAAHLAPYSNSYGVPSFVMRGYYVDLAFTCRDCGAHQVWTAAQQQWWYETAKGYVYSSAVRCLGCRQQRRRALAGSTKQ
ncbi:zinc-ribbon domain-containing protein [Chitiniphilus eburneus]|uniref:Probable zinc-binding domain-containing protein n=1 Tax=Chitiniphilus eburneus TaxID=2571148 RepID=A0A4V5MPN3_9NEIS|nr:zinc-ribbon domain-containing protein [Chitiniphilus eburneus]TJZ69378.1 hypothetical protein FAZ21_15045 [Chitiniphilus eburneus]